MIVGPGEAKYNPLHAGQLLKPNFNSKFFSEVVHTNCVVEPKTYGKPCP